MRNLLLQPYPELGGAGRVGALTRPDERLSTAELGALVGAGALGALAVAFISLPLRIPGHVILCAALPMVSGMALVPRRFSGSVMALAAAATAGVLGALTVGRLQPAAVVALVALGPAIDLDMAGSKTPGWRLYLRFALAGILANSLAFAVRAGTAWLALGGPGPHRLQQFGPTVFLSFALCGAAAGLFSAAVCFRHSAGTR